MVCALADPDAEAVDFASDIAFGEPLSPLPGGTANGSMTIGVGVRLLWLLVVSATLTESVLLFSSSLVVKLGGCQRLHPRVRS